MDRGRLERLLGDDYVVGLDHLPTVEIRARRDACTEEENGISYARRLLQGRIDILRAELVRRGDQGSDRAVSLLGRLPDILSDEHRAAPRPAHVRAPRFLVPPELTEGQQASPNAEANLLTGLGERSDDELGGLLADLVAEERALSELRHRIQQRVDVFQDELARRYKDGSADVSELLDRRA